MTVTCLVNQTRSLGVVWEVSESTVYMSEELAGVQIEVSEDKMMIGLKTVIWRV